MCVSVSTWHECSSNLLVTTSCFHWFLPCFWNGCIRSTFPSQRLQFFGVLIVIPRLSSFTVSKRRVLTINHVSFGTSRLADVGQECLSASIHQTLSRNVPRTLLWCVAMVENSQVDIRFRFLRSFNNSLCYIHRRLCNAI